MERELFRMEKPYWKTNEPRPEGWESREMISKISPPAKSETFTIPPILGCLRAAEIYLGTEVGWNATGRTAQWSGPTDQHKLFVKKYADKIKDVEVLSGILKSIAHKDSRVINAWLKENGYDIRLSDGDPTTFSVASILDLLMEWVEEGTETNITVPGTKWGGTTYPAVKMKKGFEVLVPFTGFHRNPIAKIQTKAGEIVYMTIAEEVDFSDVLRVTDHIDELKNESLVDPSYGSVTFPMVDYNQKVDISWIIGLMTGPSMSDFYIQEAVQQTKFRMNHIGARVQSAAAMMMRCLSYEVPKKSLVIDRAFLLWVERPGIKMPLLAGIFTEDCWKNPGGLM